MCVYIYVYVYISHHRRGQNCQHVEGGQKFEAIRGMQSQNAGLKMHPRNFAHITARMPARAQEWGGEEWRGQGKARAFLPFPLLVKRHPDIFLLISRFNENFFISPPLPSSSLSLEPDKKKIKWKGLRTFYASRFDGIFFKRFRIFFLLNFYLIGSLLA